MKTTFINVYSEPAMEITHVDNEYDYVTDCNLVSESRENSPIAAFWDEPHSQI